MRYSAPMKPLKITPAVGGWLHADWGDGQAWVRFGKDEGDKLARIIELHTSDPANARLVPLHRIQAAATARGSGLVQLMLALGIDQEPPAGMLSGTPAEAVAREVARKADSEPRYVLKRPRGKRLPDSFFANVARAYQSAVAHGLNPRKTISADTKTTDSTVSGWVVKARALGYLPKGEQGKITAAPPEES